MPTELFSYFGPIKAGSTSKLVELVLSGTYPLHSDYTAWYIREGDAAGGTISLQAMTAGTWVTGGLVQVNGDVFQLGIPDAALATGAKGVIIRLKDAVNNKWMYRIELVACDLTDGVRLGLTALPNAAPAAVGGLPTVDATNYIAGIAGTKNQLDDLNDLSAAQVNAEADTALADAGVTTTVMGRLDVPTSDAATPAEVETRCGAALATYDPPTRTEATSDKDAVIAAVGTQTGAVTTNVNSQTDAIDAALAVIDGIVDEIVLRTNLIPNQPATRADVLDSNQGPGADQCTLRVVIGSVPVADAQVWVTTDSSGNSIVAGPFSTDSNGEVLFLLDAGVVYYMWSQKDGVMPITSQSFTAEAD